MKIKFSSFGSNLLSCNIVKFVDTRSTFDRVITKIKRVNFFFETECIKMISYNAEISVPVIIN